jgi:predicted negative regulator of RcsB-dependent stress response
MARTRRQPVAAQADPQQQQKVTYRDPFQQNVGDKVEQFGAGLRGQGKTIMYGGIAVVVIVILAFIGYSYFKRQGAAGQAALGKAIETTQAQVSASPMPGYTGRTFATEKEKSDAVIADFQTVADKYGSPFSDRAKLFIASEQLKTDRAAGMAGLEDAAKSGDKETAALAKFALAGARESDGKLDEAAALYQDILKQSYVLPSKDTVNFALAGIYEKQNKTADAADIYFNIVKAAREAKGSDGKPLQMSGTAREASTKLEKIAPDKAKELPPEPTSTDEGQ